MNTIAQSAIDSRKQHLQWCKDRALAYVERGEYAQGITSLLSDLGKHEGTRASTTGIFARLFAQTLMSIKRADRNPEEAVAHATNFINGFN